MTTWKVQMVYSYGLWSSWSYPPNMENLGFMALQLLADGVLIGISIFIFFDQYPRVYLHVQKGTYMIF
jgi:hypothetical protein